MWKRASRKRRKFHIAFQERATRKYGKIKYTHAAYKAFGMQIGKRAVHKITAVKTFVSQIYTGKSHTGGIETDYFIVIFDIAVYFLLRFSRIRDVIQTIIIFVGNVSIFVERRNRNVPARLYKAFVQCKHGWMLKNCTCLVKRLDATIRKWESSYSLLHNLNIWSNVEFVYFYKYRI